MRALRLKYLLVGLPLAVGTVPALGAPVDKTPADESTLMMKIDPDHDGTVTLDEAKTAAAAKFEALDTDKEGTLDASELTGVVGTGTLAAADPDHDKTLDKAEFMALVAKMFAAADPDKDGTLTPQELSTEKGRALVALLAY